jgi:hypothetical protein
MLSKIEIKFVSFQVAILFIVGCPIKRHFRAKNAFLGMILELKTYSTLLF